MKRSQKIILLGLGGLMVLSLSGCSLLQAPFALAKAPFDILGQVLRIVEKLPKPPPWIFL